LANSLQATTGFVFPLRIVADVFAAGWTMKPYESQTSNGS
jgi:hypothetical protein